MSLRSFDPSTLRQAQDRPSSGQAELRTGRAQERPQGHVVVITAGLRQPSSSRLLADQLAAAVARELPDASIEIVELREYARDLTNHLLTGFPSAALAEVLERTRNADALVAVSPIFSGSYSGLFKTFFDVLEPGSLTGKPVLIAASGGTARHSLVLDHALRPLFSYLQAVVVPTGVYAAPEDWAAADELAPRVSRAAGQLAALLRAADPSGPRRAAHDSDDGEAEVSDFESLLSRQSRPGTLS